MTGVETIAAERQRQIDVEGWTPEHDDQHDRGELAAAAECYAALASDQENDIPRSSEVPLQFPFAPEWWKPSNNPERNLAKAGALVAAELDRLRRKRDRDQANQG